MQIIIAYRGILQARGWALGACLARAFRRLGHQVIEYGKYHHSTEKVGASLLPEKADALIYCECNDLDPQYLELKSVQTQWKIYWDFDVENHPGFTLSFVKEMGFTHVFCANKLYQELFSTVCDSVYYLPIGVDEQLCHPIVGVVKSIAVGLCGTPYPSRIQLINTLVQAGVEARLETGLHADQYIEAVNRYRIHLNYDVGGGRGLLPGRVWETLACGTLLLTEQQDFVNLFFQDSVDVATYSDPMDCLDKINFFLSHPNEAKQIAEQGYRTVLNNHTFLHRAQSILDAVTTDKRPSWDVAVSSPSKTAVQKAKLLVWHYKLRSRLPIVGFLSRQLKRIRKQVPQQKGQNETS